MFILKGSTSQSGGVPFSLNGEQTTVHVLSGSVTIDTTFQLLQIFFLESSVLMLDVYLFFSTTKWHLSKLSRCLMDITPIAETLVMSWSF